MSVLALAPCAQPLVHGLRLMHGARPSYSCDAIAESDGHQCQPSLSNPRASALPTLPSAIAGIGGLRGGLLGFPASPDTPIMRSFTSKNGAKVAKSSGQSSATPSV